MVFCATLNEPTFPFRLNNFLLQNCLYSFVLHLDFFLNITLTVKTWFFSLSRNNLYIEGGCVLRSLIEKRFDF